MLFSCVNRSPWRHHKRSRVLQRVTSPFNVNSRIIVHKHNKNTNYRIYNSYRFKIAFFNKKTHVFYPQSMILWCWSCELIRHCVTRQAIWLPSAFFLLYCICIAEWQYINQKQHKIDLSVFLLIIWLIRLIYNLRVKKAKYLELCIALKPVVSVRLTWIKAMATSFVVGDKFREKVTELLARKDSSLPQRLREELEETLEKPEPTVLSFSTARNLKKYLQDEGLILCYQ